MRSECLEQLPPHLCCPMGTSPGHPSPSQSLGQMSYSPVWADLWVDGNDKSLHAVPDSECRTFSNGRNLILYWKGVVKVIQDHSIHEFRDSKKFRCGSYPRFPQSPEQYPLICFRFPIFLWLCNRRGAQCVCGGFKFHILRDVQSSIQDLWEAALEKVSLHDI